MMLSDFAVYVDAAHGPVHITLPETSDKGMLVFIQKVDDSHNPVIVKCTERERIDGATPLEATSRWEGWMLVADGVKTWGVISRSFSAKRTT